MEAGRDLSMDLQQPKQPFAWQPLTPRGVASFAHASLGRLVGVQLIFALLAAGIAIWFLEARCFPVISAAIEQLPPNGQVRAGRLEWAGPSPTLLASGRFLGLAVDLKHEGGTRTASYVLIEFGATDLKLISLFGFVQVPYPAGWVIGFNRGVLGPWWGAWAPALAGLAGACVIGGLMATWALLASVYSFPAWLVGFFSNRDAGWRAMWRLSGAALMPGALVLCAALWLFGMGALDLVRLTLAGAIHFVIGWAYVVASPFALPRLPEIAAANTNPFAPAKGDGD